MPRNTPFPSPTTRMKVMNNTRLRIRKLYLCTNRSHKRRSFHVPLGQRLSKVQKVCRSLCVCVVCSPSALTQSQLKCRPARGQCAKLQYLGPSGLNRPCSTISRTMNPVSPGRESTGAPHRQGRGAPVSSHHGVECSAIASTRPPIPWIVALHENFGTVTIAGILKVAIPITVCRHPRVLEENSLVTPGGE